MTFWAKAGDSQFEQRVSALEERTRKAEAASEKLSERLQSLEDDPLPKQFDQDEAASTVDRLLGIAKPEMNDDVEALLWAHTLRRLGILSRTEYARRKKQLLARGILPATPATTSPQDGTPKDNEAAADAPSSAPTTRSRQVDE